MARSFDKVIKNGTIMAPGGAIIADMAIKEGRIAAIGHIESNQAAEIIEAQHLHILPGGIDSQVHFREPGLTHKEDLESGTRAAIMGGVTSVFEMPNTNPSTISEAALQDKLDRAKGRTYADHAFFIGAAAENVDRLAELEQLPGCCGVKIFMGSSTGSLLVPDDATLRRALKSGRRRIAIHAEDEERLRARLEMVEKNADVGLHSSWRDAESAILATKRIIALAEETKRPVHILHVTTAEEAIYLAQKKHVASFEITPQHLTLFAPDCYRELGTKAQMNPPIREKHHQDGLWEAIANGAADVVGSDHAPHTLEEKARTYPLSPSGMPGVQTLLPLLLDHHAKGRLSLERIVDLTSAGPARLYNIAGKGRLAVGYDADFVLIDLKAEWVIRKDWLQSKCGWSPFEDKKIQGKIQSVYLRGDRMVQDGALIGSPKGQPVNFWN